MNVTSEQVTKAIKNLSRRKSSGIDELSAEHIIYSKDSLSFHIANLF